MQDLTKEAARSPEHIDWTNPENRRRLDGCDFVPTEIT